MNISQAYLIRCEFGARSLQVLDVFPVTGTAIATSLLWSNLWESQWAKIKQEKEIELVWQSNGISRRTRQTSRNCWNSLPSNQSYVVTLLFVIMKESSSFVLYTKSDCEWMFVSELALKDLMKSVYKQCIAILSFGKIIGIFHLCEVIKSIWAGATCQSKIMENSGVEDSKPDTFHVCRLLLISIPSHREFRPKPIFLPVQKSHLSINNMVWWCETMEGQGNIVEPIPWRLTAHNRNILWVVE